MCGRVVYGGWARLYKVYVSRTQRIKRAEQGCRRADCQHLRRTHNVFFWIERGGTLMCALLGSQHRDTTHTHAASICLHVLPSDATRCDGLFIEIYICMVSVWQKRVVAVCNMCVYIEYICVAIYDVRYTFWGPLIDLRKFMKCE